MSRAKESRIIRHVDVFDTPSNMGGSFTVSIVRELDEERVEVRVWYGRPTPMGWEPWKEWDGYRFETSRAALRNARKMELYRER